jgi:hypothetical protein
VAQKLKIKSKKAALKQSSSVPKNGKLTQAELDEYIERLTKAGKKRRLKLEEHRMAVEESFKIIQEAASKGISKKTISEAEGASRQWIHSQFLRAKNDQK